MAVRKANEFLKKPEMVPLVSMKVAVKPRWLHAPNPNVNEPTEYEVGELEKKTWNLSYTPASMKKKGRDPCRIGWPGPECPKVPEGGMPRGERAAVLREVRKSLAGEDTCRFTFQACSLGEVGDRSLGSCAVELRDIGVQTIPENVGAAVASKSKIQFKSLSKGFRTSSGFAFIYNILSSNICDSISLYGFSRDRNHSHFFKDIEGGFLSIAPIDAIHSPKFETQLLEMLGVKIF
ncbi:unnamed protein product [Bathycoccus prasinos]